MPGPNRLSRGIEAEAAACRYLEERGLKCIDRNVRCRFGEIDLVMQAADLLVFVEVRFRRASNPVNAIDSIDAHKQRKLALTASWYLSRAPRLRNSSVRFDVIAIDGRSRGESALQWITDAFRPGA
ncbi:MAG: YraN family protein [Woeseia sp.]